MINGGGEGNKKYEYAEGGRYWVKEIECDYITIITNRGMLVSFISVGTMSSFSPLFIVESCMICVPVSKE